MSQAPTYRLAVLTHHKCASAFVRQYLRAVCDINRLLMFESHVGTARPHPDHHVSFLANATYAAIADTPLAPALHVIRNPLDIIVSAYHSHRATHGLDGWPQLQAQRTVLAGCGPEAGYFLTLAFLERAEFYPDTPGPLHALRHWNFDDPRIRTVRMEDLVGNVGAILGGMVRQSLGPATPCPDPADFTFRNMSGGRAEGEVDATSHYRSGLPDTWRTTLPSPVVAYVRAHFRTILERYYPASLG